MASKRNDDRKNVVIAGGGWGGSIVAKELSAKLDPTKYNVVLINPRPYMIYFIATARLTTTAEGKLEDTAFVPYDKLFANGNGTYKQGVVTSIDAQKGSKGGSVVLASGERIAYEALVLSPGSAWGGPLGFPDDPTDVPAHIQRHRDQFSAAKNIVIVGGGAVGIEFAGEIRDSWADKKITIVQGSDQLLNKTYPNKYRQSMERNVKARGIDILFNEYVDEIPEPGHSVTLRSGKTLDCDLVINARGPRPNTEFISSLPGALTERGFVKVTPTLNVQSYEDIWALGDVVDIDEQKQAAKAGAHADLIAANIIASFSGRAQKPYKGSYELILITNGKNGGGAYFGVLWGIMFGDWFARMLKSKDLMVPTARKKMGY